MKTTIAIPTNKKLVKELQTYAKTKGFDLKIEGNVAVINLPEGYHDSEFDDLTLKLELAFSDELNVNIPFKICKVPPLFAVRMGDLVYVDSIDGQNEIDQAKFDEIIKIVKGE